MKIIKFLKYDNYLLEALCNNTIYFNSVSNLNDPFEGIFRYRIDAKNFTHFYKNIFNGNPSKLDYYSKNIDEFNSILNEGFEWRYSNNGITCFSDKSTLRDIRMWTYYGGNHEGVCLLFESENLTFQPVINRENGTYCAGAYRLEKVTYTNKYIDQNPIEKKLNSHTFLTTKHSKWKYEKEYRFISSKPGNHSYEPSFLKTIIFGLRTKRDHEDTVKNIIKFKKNNIKFKKVKLEKDKFLLKITDDN